MIIHSLDPLAPSDQLPARSREEQIYPVLRMRHPGSPLRAQDRMPAFQHELNPTTWLRTRLAHLGRIPGLVRDLAVLACPASLAETTIEPILSRWKHTSLARGRRRRLQANGRRRRTRPPRRQPSRQRRAMRMSTRTRHLTLLVRVRAPTHCCSGHKATMRYPVGMLILWRTRRHDLKAESNRPRPRLWTVSRPKSELQPMASKLLTTTLSLEDLPIDQRALGNAKPRHRWPLR